MDILDLLFVVFAILTITLLLGISLKGWTEKRRGNKLGSIGVGKQGATSEELNFLLGKPLFSGPEANAIGEQKNYPMDYRIKVQRLKNIFLGLIIATASNNKENEINKLKTELILILKDLDETDLKKISTNPEDYQYFKISIFFLMNVLNLNINDETKIILRKSETLHISIFFLTIALVILTIILAADVFIKNADTIYIVYNIFKWLFNILIHLF